jgi:hypothetical protein
MCSSGLISISTFSLNPSAIKKILHFFLVRDADVQWEAHVFVAVHWGAKVEIADVKNSKARIRG